eukprot:SAG31_NODE_4303_length_3370_cov_1.742281_1_plen_88_part_00
MRRRFLDSGAPWRARTPSSSGKLSGGPVEAVTHARWRLWGEQAPPECAKSAVFGWFWRFVALSGRLKSAPGACGWTRRAVHGPDRPA